MISSPYFSLGMAAVGVIWLAFVGEPARGVLRDPRWRYLGWGIVAALVIVITTTVGYGYFEIRVREVAASRGTAERHLSSDQINQLITALKPVASSFSSPISVYAADSLEPSGYAVEIMAAMLAGNVKVSPQMHDFSCHCKCEL